MHCLTLKLVFTSLLLSVSCQKIARSQICSKQNTLRVIPRPVYEFSVRLLDRIAFETKGHFVYSPLSTWLQLTALSEGAKNGTLKEILHTTRLTGRKRLHCFRRNFRTILNEIHSDENTELERSSVIIVDKLYRVKKSFKTAVERLDNTHVLSLDFNNIEESANKANKIVKSNTKGAIDDMVYPNDFVNRVILMSDGVYFKSKWKTPFNQALTDIQPFFSEDNVLLGHVNMMHQAGQFNITELPLIKAKIIDVPLQGDMSLLILTPLQGSVHDTYHLLKKVSLKGIFNSFRVKSVSLSLPRFKIETEISNLRELLLDMGVKRAFYPQLAQLTGISDYKIYASLMTQLAKIDVTENYVQASVDSEYLVNARNMVEFNVEKPFVYLLVDRQKYIVLFAGMYSVPSEY